MSDKPRVREVIIVEGRYDKNALSQVVDAVIIETDGFGVYSRTDKTALIRKLAERCGAIVLTDGDAAGFQIRAYLKSTLAGLNVKHAYVPDVRGKERRKRLPGKSGLLGVEGMPPETLLRALTDCGATLDGESHSVADDNPLTVADLYKLGLTGTPDARNRRTSILRAMDLPERLSVKGLLAVANCLHTREEFASLVAATINGENDDI